MAQDHHCLDSVVLSNSILQHIQNNHIHSCKILGWSWTAVASFRL